MRNLITLNDISEEELFLIFDKADYYKEKPFDKRFDEKCFVLFFPESSIRTRVTFERGIADLGGQSILFPSDSLNKKEDYKDVIGYLNNWIDCIVIRYNDLEVIKRLAEYSEKPIINGLSDLNHPCEIITDLYGLYKKDNNFLKYNYLYVGANNNIGYAWKEASEAFGISLMQSSPDEYKIEGIRHNTDIKEAIKYADVVITDSLSKDRVEAFQSYQITKELLISSGKKIIFNPCPPFYRGEEVSADAISSEYFVGYAFKKPLINVQKAIMDFCIFS